MIANRLGTLSTVLKQAKANNVQAMNANGLGIRQPQNIASRFNNYHASIVQRMLVEHSTFPEFISECTGAF